MKPLPQVGQTDVEKWFEARYPGNRAVLVSSGRAGIVLSLLALGLGRPDWVGVAPFSSACIFRSVGEVATPVPSCVPGSFSATLLYHQWGYPHSANGDVILEDGVDSLVVDGGALYPTGGKLEILSLAKLLGVPMGAIIFCRDEQLYERLLRARHDRRHIAWPQYLLRALGERLPWALTIWHHAESGNAIVPRLACTELLRTLDRIDNIITDRKTKLAVLEGLQPEWVQQQPGRLPCCIPIENISPALLSKLGELGFLSGTRHFNARLNQSDWQLKKVLPLPIHQQVPARVIEKAADIVQSFHQEPGRG